MSKAEFLFGSFTRKGFLVAITQLIVCNRIFVVWWRDKILGDSQNLIESLVCSPDLLQGSCRFVNCLLVKIQLVCYIIELAFS